MLINVHYDGLQSVKEFIGEWMEKEGKYITFLKQISMSCYKIYVAHIK